MFSQDEYQRWFDAVARIAAVEDWLNTRVRAEGRNQEILDFYYSKPRKSLQEVATQFGITRARVHQIVKKYGHGSTKPKFTQIEVKRFMSAVGYAARVEDFAQDHGTARRYHGGYGFEPCKCEPCRKFNRERTYKTTGYQPKRTGAEYNALLKELGSIPPRGLSIEEALEIKRRHTDGSK